MPPTSRQGHWYALHESSSNHVFGLKSSTATRPVQKPTSVIEASFEKDGQDCTLQDSRPKNHMGSHLTSSSESLNESKDAATIDGIIPHDEPSNR